MKFIVTHRSPDLDAICSAWLIKKFLPGWNDAAIRFVPAGERIQSSESKEIIEHIDGDEVIHVDTGLGPLDHHQIQNNNVCAASLTFDFVSEKSPEIASNKTKEQALRRIVNLVIDEDHFQQVYYKDPVSDIYDFSVVGLLDGYKMEVGFDDQKTFEFGLLLLNAALHTLENKIWAEEELKEKGRKFDTVWGKGLGIESINDAVLDIAQKMGYAVVVRKDLERGTVRIKAKPKRRIKNPHFAQASRDKQELRIKDKEKDIDLTSVYEKLKQMDPDASWYLHISKRMLLNGSSKNPKMKGSHLTLTQVIEVLKNSK